MKKTFVWSGVAAVVGGLLLMGCDNDGGDDSEVSATPPANTAADVAGHWRGFIRWDSGGFGSTYMDLIQIGNDLGGTVEGAGRVVLGRVDGNSVYVKSVFPPPVNGESEDALTAAGSFMSGRTKITCENGTILVGNISYTRAAKGEGDRLETVREDLFMQKEVVR